MASKPFSTLALFLTLNLLFFSLVSTCDNLSSLAPTPSPSPSPMESCPRDVLKLGACANVLHGLVNATVGQQPVTPCCTLLDGLVDLQAAVCLCSAIKANILGINLNFPVSLTLLLSACSMKVPRDFRCA